ncbi:unnamed protein product, partial [Meganyctiphanes norvegica]
MAQIILSLDFLLMIHYTKAPAAADGICISHLNTNSYIRQIKIQVPYHPHFPLHFDAPYRERCKAQMMTEKVASSKNYWIASVTVKKLQSLLLSAWTSINASERRRLLLAKHINIFLKFFVPCECKTSNIFQPLPKICRCLGHFRCTCDETSPVSMKTWRWGGCGDNLKYGTRFAKRLFVGGSKKKRKKSSEKKRSLDIKSQVDAHNAMAGMLVVMEGTTKTCKCHGVSGSCAMMTCWNQLPSFSQSGHLLTQMYHAAVIADTKNAADIGNRTKKKSSKKNKGTKSSNVSVAREKNNDLKLSIKIKRKSKRSLDFQINIDEKYQIFPLERQPRELYSPPKNIAAVNNKLNRENSPKIKNMLNDNFVNKDRQWTYKKNRFPGPLNTAAPLGSPRQLLYLDRSPNFCRSGRYGPGTAERQCVRSQTCENLCCGRGYHTRQVLRTEPCQCKVIWCCNVQCENCTSLIDVYTCK